MPTTTDTSPSRFFVSKNAMGITSIVDGTKKGNGNKGVIALFFRDPQWDARAEMYASVSAAALNDEAARRAKKE